MKRGWGNFIGSKKNVKRVATSLENSGVYDIVDNHFLRVDNAWPLTKRVLLVNPSATMLNEGSTFSVTISTEGYENADTLYYTISAVTGTVDASDFADGTISGSFTLTNNTGSFSKTLILDGTSEANDSFVIEVRSGSISGQILSTSATVTITNPTFSVTPTSSSFNEGASVTFNITTTNVPNTTLYYSLSGIATADITSGITTGSFTLTSNSGSFSITGVEDFTTEGNETITCSIRLGSISGTVVATTTVVLNDTSMTPSATVTPSVSSVNEGSSVSFTINTTNLSTGTLYWKTTGVTGNNMNTDFTTSNTGTVAISGSTGTVNLTLALDTFDEGTESFVLNVMFTGLNGAIIGTSSAVTINDTSTGGGEEPLALYDFTTFTFTNATMTGRLGPTLTNCLTSYNTSTNPWLNNTVYFNVVTQGYQLWTVPATGNYEITAIGAAGGNSSPGYGYGVSGKGAQMVSTVSLTQGDKLKIVVGQMGTGTANNNCGRDGGGGGGSFVATETNTPLLVAGGGGGAGSNGNGREETLKHAPDSTTGGKGSGTTGGAGGTAGGGGAIQSGSCVNGGGGGGGFTGNGGTNGQSNAGLSFVNGATGGTGGNAGGFGGGGGAGQDYAAGGGGGYSGGGGGCLQTCSCSDMGNGGGGGSYSSTTYVYTAQIGTSHGSVTITRL